MADSIFFFFLNFFSFAFPKEEKKIVKGGLARLIYESRLIIFRSYFGFSEARLRQFVRRFSETQNPHNGAIQKEI